MHTLFERKDTISSNLHKSMEGQQYNTSYCSTFVIFLRYGSLIFFMENCISVCSYKYRVIGIIGKQD